MARTPNRTLDTPVVIDPSAIADEVQKVTVTAEGGTFKVKLLGEETSALKFNATATEVEAAVNALKLIAPGDVQVSGGPGDATGSKPYIFTFGDALADEDVAAMTTDATALTGTTHTAVVATVTQGEGDPNAVIRGKGWADRTEDVSPLTGQSPAAKRAANAAEFGD